MKAILYIGHGTRSKNGAKEAKGFIKRVMKRMNADIQEMSFLELTEPFVDEGFHRCVERGATSITVIPLFLLAAGHIKQDIPKLLTTLKARYPGVVVEMKDPFGVQDQILDAVAELVTIRAGRLEKEDSLLIVGRGSSDPGILADFSKIKEGLKKRLHTEHVSVCYLAAVEPMMENELERVVEKKDGTIVVVPYLLFSGLLSARVERETVRWKKRGRHLVLTEPLSCHQLIEDVVLQQAAL